MTEEPRSEMVTPPQSLAKSELERASRKRPPSDALLMHVVLVRPTGTLVVFLRHINDEIGLGAAGFLLEDGAFVHPGYASCSTLSATPSTMSLTFSL